MCSFERMLLNLLAIIQLHQSVLKSILLKRLKEITIKKKIKTSNKLFNANFMYYNKNCSRFLALIVEN